MDNPIIHSIVKYLASIAMIVLLSAVILGIIVLIILGIYSLIKWIKLERKDAIDWQEYYEEKYDREVEELRMKHDEDLRSKSEEYFRKFYNEEMAKKKEEQNGNEV